MIFGHFRGFFFINFMLQVNNNEISGAQQRTGIKIIYGAFTLFSSYYMSEEMGSFVLIYFIAKMSAMIIAAYNCQRRILNS